MLWSSLLFSVPYLINTAESLVLWGWVGPRIGKHPVLFLPNSEDLETGYSGAWFMLLTYVNPQVKIILSINPQFIVRPSVYHI